MNAMNPEHLNSDFSHHSEVDPWELQQFLRELSDWEITGGHHMHKSWQFQTCEQALQWHGMAKVLSERHGGDCLYYLGHVGSGRIETDIINPIHGHLIRDDLAVAMMLNTLEKQIKQQATPD